MFARHAFRPANTLRHHVRRYATETTEAPKGSNTKSIVFLGVLGAALSGSYIYMRRNRPFPARTGKMEQAEPKLAFTGGEQGFLSLPLESYEVVNHNTKLLRFKLPEPDMESGLPVACEPPEAARP